MGNGQAPGTAAGRRAPPFVRSARRRPERSGGDSVALQRADIACSSRPPVGPSSLYGCI